MSDVCKSPNRQFKLSVYWHHRKILSSRHTAEARPGANDSPVSRIKSEWSKFRDLLPLLASSALPLGAKSILYSCVCVALCYMEKRFKRDLKKKIRG